MRSAVLMVLVGARSSMVVATCGVTEPSEAKFFVDARLPSRTIGAGATTQVTVRFGNGTDASVAFHARACEALVFEIVGPGGALVFPDRAALPCPTDRPVIDSVPPGDIIMAVSYSGPSVELEITP